MTTVRTKTFKSGNSEAVRLPKDIAFGEGVELIAERNGDIVTLYPAQKPRVSMDEMFEALNKLPAPSSVQKRDKIAFPKRRGL